MADSFGQALRFLRGAGWRKFFGAVGRRVASTFRLFAHLEPSWSEPLPVAAARLALGGHRAGDVVWSMQKRAEIVCFLEMVSRAAPRVVLEIGTAAGGTLHLLARAAAPDALILSIDLPRGPFGGGYASWRRILYPRLVSRRQSLRLLRADSHATATVDRVRSILDGRQVDLLFIDGDHSYEGVKRDFELYRPLVSATGIVAFHDIELDPAVPGNEVFRFWNELRISGARTLDLIEGLGPNGYGIGVLLCDERSR